MDRTEESQLIKKAASGNERAFEKLLTANQSGVYNLALKLLKNREDALDCSQEVFFKAYMNLNSFRGDCKFSAWLYRLTYNQAMDILRKKSRENDLPLTVEDKDGGEREIEIPDTENDPAQKLEKAEEREIIRREINALPDDMRNALVMREYGGMSYAEIADAMNIQEGTVKSRIARARQRLAENLAGYGTFEKYKRQNEQKEVTCDE